MLDADASDRDLQAFAHFSRQRGDGLHGVACRGELLDQSPGDPVADVAGRYQLAAARLRHPAEDRAALLMLGRAVSLYGPGEVEFSRSSLRVA